RRTSVLFQQGPALRLPLAGVVALLEAPAGALRALGERPAAAAFRSEGLENGLELGRHFGGTGGGAADEQREKDADAEERHEVLTRIGREKTGKCLHSTRAMRCGTWPLRDAIWMYSPSRRPSSCRPRGDAGVTTISRLPSKSTSIPPARGPTKYVSAAPCGGARVTTAPTAMGTPASN